MDISSNGSVSNGREKRSLNGNHKADNGTMDTLETNPAFSPPEPPNSGPDSLPHKTRLSFQDPEDNILNQSFSDEESAEEGSSSQESGRGLFGAELGGMAGALDGLLISKPKRQKNQLPLIVHAKNGNSPEKKILFEAGASGDRMDAYPVVHPRSGVPRAPAPKDLLTSYRYSMEHGQRGLAVIINNRNFSMENTPYRKGSDNDAALLEVTLKKLEFDVSVYTDLNVRTMQDCFRYYSNQNHTEYDCFFCAIFSHGEEGIIYGTDGKLGLNELTMMFRGDKCTTLAGKPKIFVIQACRGDRLDAGMDLTQADAPSTFRIPAEADFLYAFSTVPGYFSWRNTELGSWFIQALCHMLDQHALDPEMDLLKLLTRVSHQVAFGHESNVPSDMKWHRKKQIPSIVSMLTKDLFFVRKAH